MSPATTQGQRTWLATFVLGLATAWVRLYTIGLPASTRSARRAELASDLYEHETAAERTGAPFAAELAWRWATGVPADISWRMEHARIFGQVAGLVMAALGRGLGGCRWTVRRGLPGVTFCLVGFYVIVGVFLIATLGFQGNSPPSQRVVIAGFLLGSALLIVIGLRLVRRHRGWGMAVLVVGTLPLAMAMSASVIVPMASAAAVVTGGIRSFRSKAVCA